MAAQALAGRIALVTGASRGVGAAVAERMAAEGAHVYALARSEAELERLNERINAGGGIGTMVPLDLTIGNAAVLGTLSPLGHIRPHVWDRVIEVNLTANWRLIRSMDPLLHQSDAGRVMFVTSGVARRPRAFWGAYAVSKSAVEMLAGIYAEEVAKTHIRVNVIDPGVVRTGMRAQAMPGEDPATLPPPDAITDTFVELARPDCTRHGDIVPVTVAAEN